MMRRATPDEIRRWDELVAGAPGGESFWQQTTYARLKPAWRALLVVHELPDGPLPAMYLQRRLPGFGAYWYCPSGPRVATAAQLAAVCDDLREHSPAFAVTLEPPLPADGPEAKDRLVETLPGVVASPDVQLSLHTVVVDLRPSEEELLASFKQRARRALRKAEKAGAWVDGPRTDEAAMDEMWRLYAETAERNGLMIRGRAYHEGFWRAYLQRGEGAFFLARPTEDGQVSAAAFVIRGRELAVYKDGGSLRTREAGGLQYLLQWEIMRWAKGQGCSAYDMLGAPPSWSADDESHGLHGLVQFKTSFAEISDEVGAMTLVRRPALWGAWERVGRRVADRYLARRNQYFY